MYWVHNDACFFKYLFVYVYKISSRNNALIFNFSNFSDCKVNIVGAFDK